MLALALYASCLVESAFARSIREVPFPIGTRVALISSDMRHNGLPLAMAAVDSDHPLEQTLRFYRQLWPREEASSVPGMIQTQLGQWLIISRLRDGYNTVLQFSTLRSDRTQGFVSVLPVNGAQAMTGDSDASVATSLSALSTTESSDLTGKSALSVYRSELRPDALVSQQVASRLAGGWVLEFKQRYQTGIRVAMRRGAVSLDMVASLGDEGGTLLIINEVTHEKR